MSFDPVAKGSSRRSFLRSAAIVGAGLGATSLLGTVAAAEAQPAVFTHPGLLHTAASFTDLKAKSALTAAPWASGWAAVKANARSQSGPAAKAVAALNLGGSGENYVQLLDDAHAAYQNALLWKLTGTAAYADTARNLLNAWSQTLATVSGTPYLGQTAGLYGFLLANAAEIVRDYTGFDKARFTTVLANVFYPMANTFLTAAPDSCQQPSYATNWELSHIASTLAIGVFCDDTAKVDQAATLITGTPRIMNSIPYAWDGGVSERYSVTGLSLLAVICEMAWSQGLDLYGSHGNRLLAASEQVARYQPAASLAPALGTWGTSATSSGWALIHNHYATRQGLVAPNTAVLADKARAEGGGFDQLGFGSLAYSL